MKVLSLSVLVVLLDQVSKFAVRLSFEYGKPYKILGNWFRFTYIENPGMAFGIQVGGQKFFTTFAIIATIAIFIFMVRARGERMPLRVSLALILGGAIGNQIDRLLYGKVVDFVELVIVQKRMPIFNLADVAVFIGMGMLIWLILADKSNVNPKTAA